MPDKRIAITSVGNAPSRRRRQMDGCAGIVAGFDLVLDAGAAGDWLCGGEPEKDNDEQRVFSRNRNVAGMGVD